ncbi:hypothetical protein ACFLWW_01375 [Chloroflexota bacterium]
MFKKQVKCSECGFLALFLGFSPVPNYSSPQLLEMLQHSEGRQLFAPQECPQQVRGEITNGKLQDTRSFRCIRNVWTGFMGKNVIPKEDMLESLNSERYCPYFFSYIPGYIPSQHLELQRERSNRRFLIKVSLLSAVVGAVIALIANYIISLITTVA